MLKKLLFTFTLTFCCQSITAASKPNIVLVMTDDQGWGQMGYYHHPVLKTPILDRRALNGLRFARFYAGPPIAPLLERQ